MLNYRRLIAFTSRVHTYLTVLYIVVFSLFFLSMQLNNNEILFNMLSTLSYAIGWTITLLGFFLLLASIHISFQSKVLALEPFILTVLRLALYFVLSLILAFIVEITSDGLRIGIRI